MTQPFAVDAPLLTTPLGERHRAMGARMTPFAGFEMPLHYTAGILAEHLWTREHAGLFDVSHMGQAVLRGPDHETVARALEALIPADILGLKPGQQRYSQLLDEEGGIIDDMMVSRPVEPGPLSLVVNASTKVADYAHIAARLPAGVTLEPRPDLALIALQGPAAARVFERLAPGAAGMPFMTVATARVLGCDIAFSRSGYTGEDGYEISAPADRVGPLWDALVSDESVRPIGLGARDSLRLEAGLCLYGHAIDRGTSPVEAGLAGSIGKRRRVEGGFPGAGRVQRELAEGPSRRRVGLLPEGRAPAREGAEIVTEGGAPAGLVTSGGFGPSLGRPVAMGIVASAYAAPGTALNLMVRGRPLAARVTAMPFVPHRYVRKTPGGAS